MRLRKRSTPRTRLRDIVAKTVAGESQESQESSASQEDVFQAYKAKYEEMQKQIPGEEPPDLYAAQDYLFSMPWEHRRKLVRYNEGGEGFVKFIEDFEVAIEVYVDGLPTYVPLCRMDKTINPVTQRSSYQMWEQQQRVCREALYMDPYTKQFKHTNIIFVWMRGEGKSLLVCLIQLWKFFCFPSQKIMLGANSKDQVKFVHYDIMKNIILNSPKLMEMVGTKNVQEKEVRLTDADDNVVSYFRSISSFSGIVSNITGYTFSEMFDMKNPKFFTQLDGSIRNIPNALGIIDSTVSDRTHVLYKMYASWVKGEKGTDRMYYSYRCSPKANYKDYWNPYNSQAQLDAYQMKFPPAEFDMYFRNTWDSGSSKVFTPAIVDALRYIGYNNSLGMQNLIVKNLAQYHAFFENRENSDAEKREFEIKMKSPLIEIDEIYTLTDSFGQPRMATADEVQELGRRYDTDWSILCGIDRADPMKKDITKGARTMVTFVAKGLPGSKSNPSLTFTDKAVRYMYFLVHIVHVEMNDITTIQESVEEVHAEYNGVDTLCTERWGMWDIGDWCESLGIQFEAITAGYGLQQAGFSELAPVIKEGRFKSPPVAIRGSKSDDILKEEIGIFESNAIKKFYGSPEKMESRGVQDDAMFSVNWAIYGGRTLGPMDFRPIMPNNFFGVMFENKDHIGDY